MKRIILLAILTVALLGLQIFVNCSDPLESLGAVDPDPQPPAGDTDTVYIYDTVIIDGDTVYMVDTLIVVDPGPGEDFTVCSILLANLREIIWTFDNAEGPYSLTFTASPEPDHDWYTILIDIDGVQLPYEWGPAYGLEYTIEVDLPANATIVVHPDRPLLLGHKVDICLTITAQ